jgi:hypothetical protein
METETKERTESPQEVTQFVNQYGNTELKRDLLRFWNRYPYAKFTSGIIAHALHNRKVDIEEALESLVKATLIEKHTRQGLLFYCLTADPERRQWILSLSAYRGNFRSLYARG